jgi:protein gp37
MSTGIEWTDETWNPLRGCSRKSQGCVHCYAEPIAARFSGKGQPYEGLAHFVTRPDGSREARWTGTVAMADDRVLTQPLRWREPRKVFVNSMSDLFHEDVPDEWIDRIFAVMALAPQHTFQILTKRPERMRAWFAERWQGTTAAKIGDLEIPAGKETGRQSRVEFECEPLLQQFGLADTENDEMWTAEGDCKAMQWQWPLPNVWLGVSTEDQAAADERIPILLDTPAAVRWISAEPLLGPIDLRNMEAVAPGRRGWSALADARPGHATLDWVVVGGESGPHARPMHPDWARSLRDQCQQAARSGATGEAGKAGVPFFFKQWGSWRPSYDRDQDDPDWRQCDVIERETPQGRWLNIAAGQGFHGERVVRMTPITKSNVLGRTLDARTWDEFPARTEAAFAP